MFYPYELYSLQLMFYPYELYSLRLMFYRYELYSLLVSSQCKCTSAPSDPGFSRDGSPGHTNGTMPFFYTLNVSLWLQHQSGQLQCTPPGPPPPTPTPPLLESLSISYLRVSVHGAGVGELGYGPVALSLFRTYNDQVQSLSRVRWLNDVEGFDHSGRWGLHDTLCSNWVWPFNYWYESFTRIIVAHLSDWKLFHYRHRRAVRRRERVLLLSLLLFQHNRLQRQTSVACGNEHCYSCRKVKLTGFFCPRRVTCVWRWRTFHSARLDRDSVPPVAQQSTDGVSVGSIAW